MKAEAQQDAITDFAGRYQDGLGNPVILDLLRRRPPRLRSGRHGPLLPDRPNLPADLLALVQDLDGTTLCIQGPPGSGKTHNAAAVIVELVSSGKRVGVCSNSHRAIEKLLVSVCETSRVSGKPIDVLKAGGADTGDQRMRHCDNNKVAEHLGTEALVVGATAWAFARPELRDVFDYIFVDEAGQVSLANAVAVGMATQNLILIGDQMQLAQPSKGTHPADSGLSCFHYYLKDCATVPPDRGVLLPLTWRLHPDICRFISDTAYEGRLECVPATSQRCVEPPADARLLTRGSGIVMLDVEHDGNTYDSPEEVNRIAELVDELRRAMFRDGDEPARGFDPGRDLLVVAPYNAQVRRLRERLPDIRIASVDKFQGQEASVVIVSMCASSLDETPRGAGFLLSPNRLNVAVSRAQCLAFVVSSPRLIRTRPKSVKEIELLNLFCRLRFYASELSSQIQSGAVRV
ncbi:MAG TPA: AAA domain-containing protein [Hyphomicrobium sp.]|nr:AAA domain-containing protein [Hyphomicrobium sp.]